MMKTAVSKLQGYDLRMKGLATASQPESSGAATELPLLRQQRTFLYLTIYDTRDAYSGLRHV